MPSATLAAATNLQMPLDVIGTPMFDERLQLILRLLTSKARDRKISVKTLRRTTRWIPLARRSVSNGDRDTAVDASTLQSTPDCSLAAIVFTGQTRKTLSRRRRRVRLGACAGAATSNKSPSRSWCQPGLKSRHYVIIQEEPRLPPT